MHTAESIFSNFGIEYLGEIETEFENILACLSGAQMGWNHEKNWRSKISWHTPFLRPVLQTGKKQYENQSVLRKNWKNVTAFMLTSIDKNAGIISWNSSF